VNIDILVKRFQEKDEKALESLYEIYAKSITGVIYQIVKEESIAEELVQDVFIKAWNKSDSYSPKKGRFFTWLINIARNTAIDKLRTKAYKQDQKKVKSSDFSHLNLVQEAHEIKEESINIRKYLQELSAECKRVIDMIFFQGYSQRETAEELKLPLGTIKSRSRRCLMSLRKMIKR